MMKARRTPGMSLVETLAVVAISAIVVGGAATYFRTIRQVYDQAERRREAMQLARGILDHVVRRTRDASLVTNISKYTDNDAKLEFTNGSGVKCTYQFNLGEGEFRYKAEGLYDFVLIKDNTRLTLVDFKAYDINGTATTVVNDIAAVETFVTVAIPNTTQTVSASTLVWLRNKSAGTYVRQATCYASSYTTIFQAGFTNPSWAFGAPDGQYATIGQHPSGNEGSFQGFQQSTYTGKVYTICAGILLRYTSGTLGVKVYYNTTQLLNTTYSSQDLGQYLGTWGWLWIDFTSKRGSWSDTDIPKLKVYLSNNGSNQYFDIDSIAIRAFFDATTTSTYWADRQGSGVVPNQWLSANNALNGPDKMYATGDFASQQTQTYRVTPNPGDSSDQIITVGVVLQAYVPTTYKDDVLEVRALLPSDAAWVSPLHSVDSSTLNSYKGASNAGLITVDVSSDRAWAWTDLNGREIRLRCNRWTSPTTISVDAVGWKVLHVPHWPKGIESWSVQ